MTTPKGKCDECGKKRALPDGIMCSGCRQRLRFHRTAHVPPAPERAVPKIPKTARGYPLGEIKQGRLAPWHPRGGNFDCPYCGRDNPIDQGHSGAVGFRIAGWGKHLYCCYEKELLRQGWIVGRYIYSKHHHILERVKPKDVRMYAKRLKVPFKDIPVTPPPLPKKPPAIKGLNLPSSDHSNDDLALPHTY